MHRGFLQGEGGGGLNIFFRGRNAHQGTAISPLLARVDRVR